MMEHHPLTPKLALGIAAPHTWVASITPVFLGAALAAFSGQQIPTLLFCCLLAISVLMQSAVNALNDYYDFVKGTDTLDNSDDPSDAILVYNNIRPKSVQLLGVGFLVAAALLGIYVVVQAGWVPLLLGVIGGAVIVLYSAGRTPLSYLPVGELVSGFVMGGLITMAVAYSLGSPIWPALYHALPLIIGIGLIMFANNTSDIERDISSGRRTLSVLLGRKGAVLTFRIVTVLWLLLVAHLIFHDFSAGVWLLPVSLLVSALAAWKLLRLPFTPDTRYQALPGIVKLNMVANGCYIVMILAAA